MRKLRTLITFIITAAALTITVHAYDLRTVSGITADELAEYMHPETRHLAADVVRICEREGVSAEFVAVVMRWERRPDLHNYFGWTCDDGVTLMSFKSDIDCLEYCIPLLKSLYLTEGGRWYGDGYTVADVSKRFNDSDFWREKITEGLSVIISSNQSGKEVMET